MKPSKSVDMIRGHSIHYRELARILFFTFGYPIHHNTVKLLWPKSAVPPSPPPTQGAYHARADRVHARLQIVRLY